jgi:hypothetical protein
VEARELAPQPAQLDLELGLRGLRQHAVGEIERLLELVERPAQEFADSLRREVLLDRAVGQPVEVAARAAADALARQQFDDPHAIQDPQPLHDLALGQLVPADHVGERPVVQRQHGHQQQPLVRDQLRFLGARQRIELRHRGGRGLQQLGERETEELADLGQPLDREALAREQPLDAGLGQFQVPRHVQVGLALGFQLAFHGVDQMGDFGIHGYHFSILVVQI